MTTKADTSTSTRQEIETRLDAFYAAWQARDRVGMRALFGGGDRLLVWSTARDERIEGRAEADRELDGWVDACPSRTSLEVTWRARRSRLDRRRGDRNMVLREQQRSRALPHHHRPG